MKKLNEHLRVCPFCKSDHTDDWTWISHLPDGRYILCHYCKPEPEGYDRVVTVYGDSEDECIERWNADGKEHSPE